MGVKQQYFIFHSISPVEQYTDFTAEEFLNDPLFRNWLIEPSERTDHIWQEFLLRFPEKEKAVAEARALFKALDGLQTQASSEQGRRLWETIRGRTEPDTGSRADEPPTFRLTRVWRAMAAASVLLCVALAGWLLLSQDGAKTAESYAEHVAGSDAPLVEKVNEGNQPREVLLPDGSRILLEPLGRISYPPVFRVVTERCTWRGRPIFR